jgi:hypothetical protein
MSSGEFGKRWRAELRYEVQTTIPERSSRIERACSLSRASARGRCSCGVMRLTKPGRWAVLPRCRNFITNLTSGFASDSWFLHIAFLGESGSCFHVSCALRSSPQNVHRTTAVHKLGGAYKWIKGHGSSSLQRDVISPLLTLPFRC